MNTNETKMNEMKLYGMASSFKSLVDTRQDKDLSSHELLSVLLQADGRIAGSKDWCIMPTSVTRLL